MVAAVIEDFTATNTAGLLTALRIIGLASCAPRLRAASVV
jgi:hypothetical protein